MPLIRKERAGNDSFGNSWPEDGAVVKVDPEHVPSLLAIEDGGFSEVTPATKETPEDPTPPEDPEEELSEVDPDAPAGEPESKPAAKKTTARKTTASRKTVEEG
ncbi:MAG: hypothetical protein HOY76_21545 [Streptomyces sp.]|nr:hypothetical protein [Streptomyces sp.]